MATMLCALFYHLRPLSCHRLGFFPTMGAVPTVPPTVPHTPTALLGAEDAGPPRCCSLSALQWRIHPLMPLRSKKSRIARAKPRFAGRFGTSGDLESDSDSEPDWTDAEPKVLGTVEKKATPLTQMMTRRR